MISKLRRLVAALVVISVGGLGLPLPVYAGLVSTDSAMAGVEKARIWRMIERAEVRSQLEAYGISPADVKARRAALTD